MPHEQNPFGNSCPKADKFFWFFQKFHDFLQFLFGFVGPGDIIEGNGGMIPGEHAGAAFAEGHGLVVVALGLAEDEVDKPKNEENGQEDAGKGQKVTPLAGAFIGNFEVFVGRTG